MAPNVPLFHVRWSLKESSNPNQTVLTQSSFNRQGHADAEDYTESDDEGADGYRHWDYLQALSLFFAVILFCFAVSSWRLLTHPGSMVVADACGGFLSTHACVYIIILDITITI